MSTKSFPLKVLIMRSRLDIYKENKITRIFIKKKMGEGSYGIVYLLNDNNIIKIFKNSTSDNLIASESDNLIPIKYENREIMFFLKYINETVINTDIIELYAIGVIKDIIIDRLIKLDINSYFVILPLCIPFYKNIKYHNIPLIDKHNGLHFTIVIMKRLLEICYSLESRYNIINIDSKLNNFMFIKDNPLLQNLIMIDFSILKKKSKKKYNALKKYYIWSSQNMLLEHFTAYSICINGLELLFGHKKVLQLPDGDLLNFYLKAIKEKDKNIYNIFYTGLVTKIDTENFLKLITDHIK